MHVIKKKPESDRVTKITPAPQAKPLPPGVPQFLTVEEVAAMLRCQVRTIYQMVHKKRIPFRKAGRRTLFDPQEIEAWTKPEADNQ
jgi:excisionase family DNA binding protein